MASPIERQDGVSVFGNSDDVQNHPSPKKNLIQKIARFFGFSKGPSAESRLGSESGASPWAPGRVKHNPIYLEYPEDLVIDKDDSGLGRHKDSPVEQFERVIIAHSKKDSPVDLLVEKQFTLSSQNSKSPEFSEDLSGTMVFKPIQHAPVRSTSLEEGASGSMVVNSVKSNPVSAIPAFMKNHNFEDNAGKWDQYLEEDEARIAAEETYIPRVELDLETEKLYAVLPCDRDGSEVIIIENLPHHITCSVRALDKDSSEIDPPLISTGHVERLVELYSNK